MQVRKQTQRDAKQGQVRASLKLLYGCQNTLRNEFSMLYHWIHVLLLRNKWPQIWQLKKHPLFSQLHKCEVLELLKWTLCSGSHIQVLAHLSSHLAVLGGKVLPTSFEPLVKFSSSLNWRTEVPIFLLASGQGHSQLLKVILSSWTPGSLHLPASNGKSPLHIKIFPCASFFISQVS